MRTLVLFALTLGSVAALADDAFAFGKRKNKSAAVTYAAPMYGPCDCDGYPAGYHGGPGAYHGQAPGAYYGQPGAYHHSGYPGAYPGSPYHSGYQGTYSGPPHLMPGAPSGTIVPSGGIVVPGQLPPKP